MRRQKWDVLGDRVQILRTYIRKIIVIMRNDKVVYLIYGNVMVDNPTKTVCEIALQKNFERKYVHLN